jgi:hypothetical protein
LISIELAQTQTEYLHSIKSTEKDFILRITSFINSLIIFSREFMELIDILYEKLSTEIIENHFEEKFISISNLFIEISYNAIEITSRNYFITEIYKIFNNQLFSSVWENDMKTLFAMKKFIKNSLLQFNIILYQHALAASNEGDGNGAVEGGEAAGGNSAGSLSSTSLVQENYENIKVKLLVNIIEGILTIYLEILLTNGYLSINNLNITVIGRLNEDLQMLTTFIEELRQIILKKDFYYYQNIHIVSSSAATGGSKSGKKRERKYFFKKKKVVKEQSATDLNAEISQATAVTNQQAIRLATKKEIYKNIENKQLFDELLSPLTHVILAIQMAKNYLVDFVKSELYYDFGYYNALRIWQLLLYWRGIKKEEILNDFDIYLKDWNPSTQQANFEPKLSINYLNKVKVANFIKSANTTGGVVGDT